MASTQMGFLAILLALLVATPEARSLRVHNATKNGEVVAKVEDHEVDKDEEDHEVDKDEEDHEVDKDEMDTIDPADDELYEEKMKENKTDAPLPFHALQVVRGAGEATGLADITLIGEVDDVEEDQEAAQGFKTEDSETAKQDVPGKAKKEVRKVDEPAAAGMEKYDAKKHGDKSAGVYNPITNQMEAEAFIQTARNDVDDEDLDEDDSQLVGDSETETDAEEQSDFGSEEASEASDEDDTEETTDSWDQTESDDDSEDTEGIMSEEESNADGSDESDEAAADEDEESEQVDDSNDESE